VYAHTDPPAPGLSHIGANTALKNTTKLKHLEMAASNENYIHKEVTYKEQSVNRSQMDTKHKTYDIQTWRKHLFLNISSMNIYTRVPFRSRKPKLTAVGIPCTDHMTSSIG
jgi:hypothetical protein